MSDDTRLNEGGFVLFDLQRPSRNVPPPGWVEYMRLNIEQVIPEALRPQARALLARNEIVALEQFIRTHAVNA